MMSVCCAVIVHASLLCAPNFSRFVLTIRFVWSLKCICFSCNQTLWVSTSRHLGNYIIRPRLIILNHVPFERKSQWKTKRHVKINNIHNWIMNVFGFCWRNPFTSVTHDIKDSTKKGKNDIWRQWLLYYWMLQPFHTS